MKSSNDIYHGDEHLVEGKSTWRIVATEIVKYEVEVEAESEDEALDKAYQEFKDNADAHEVDRYDFVTDDVYELPRLNMEEDY